jgi:hypothetical protein
MHVFQWRRKQFCKPSGGDIPLMLPDSTSRSYVRSLYFFFCVSCKQCRSILILGSDREATEENILRSGNVIQWGSGRLACWPPAQFLLVCKSRLVLLWLCVFCSALGNWMFTISPPEACLRFQFLPHRNVSVYISKSSRLIQKEPQYILRTTRNKQIRPASKMQRIFITLKWYT